MLGQLTLRAQFRIPFRISFVQRQDAAFRHVHRVALIFVQGQRDGGQHFIVFILILFHDVSDDRDYKGILPCFLAGFVKLLVFSWAKARMTRKRVLRGSITSSI